MGGKKIKRYLFTIRRHKFQVIADKVLLLRALQNLHGRFWGITALHGMTAGLTVCFLIRPDMWQISTAFSDFGNDVRTAPFFAGSMFFAAYGLWRWRNYLSRTLRRSGVVLGLLTLTIIGLYLVAFMPVSWKPLPYKLHFFGVFLAGCSMALTVIVDGLLTKVKSSSSDLAVRFFRLLAFAFIAAGGYITYGSSESVHWYNLSLLGETLIVLGYAIWVYLKTRLGEGPRSKISRILQKVIIVK